MAGTNASGNPYDNNESFYKAMPIGNGRIGAMVYGNYPDEKIDLNEATFWSGGPGTNDKAGAADKIAQAQALEYAGKYTDADTYITNNLIGGGEAKYQSVGDLELAFGHTDVTNYSRQLDMNTGVVSCDYDCDGKTYHRESFVSYPDQVLVTKISCTTPGSISLTAKYGCSLTGQFAVSTDGSDTLVMDGHGDDGAGVNYAVSFQTRSKFINTNGTVSADSGAGSVSVKDADSVVILTAIRTNFVDYKTTNADQKALAISDIAKVSSTAYETLYSNHETDYQNLFKRVDVDLGGTGSENDKPMGQRISEFGVTQDPKLVKVLYQYGRYLMISGSREGGQPMNLQGIWNKFRNPAWDCKLTTNINYEMNYWPAFTTNLSECFEPFIEKAKALSVAGQYTAKNTYNIDTGWVVNHNTDIWNRTAPIDGAWGLWPTGAGWISDQLYDAYNFNQNPSYLSNIYPVIQGSADFLQAFMQQHEINGQDYQVICPSTSPEVNPPSDSGGQGASTSYSVTMDNAISRSVFQDVIQASKILDKDSGFSSTLQSKVAMIRPDQVGRLGQLQEWAYDWDSPTETNRHISFAYNLFPGNQISKRNNRTIYDAVAKSLNIRGDEGTGWSEGWKLNCWARMEDGEHAYNLVKLLISPVNGNGRLYDNLWDAHPPFQIDGNFGFTSGVTEMLLQSQDNEINLLPALPSEWSTGHANGLCARGGFEVSQAWANGALTGVTIKSNAGNLCNVRYGGKTVSFQTKKGQTYQLNGNLQLMGDSAAVLSNVALNKAATGSNESSSSAAQAVDGSAATSWSDLKDSAMSGQWLQLDLGAQYDISRWVVKAPGYKNNPRDFTLQKSDDGNDWTDVDAVYGNEQTVNDRNVPTFHTRYVRLLINNATQDNSGGARISELELWGVNEAENGTLGGNAKVISDANASGDKAVNLSAEGDSLTFANVPKSSKLTVGYSTESADGKLSLYVNNAHSKDVTFTNTSGAYSAVTVPTSIPSNATVKLAFDAKDSAVKLDYVTFTALSALDLSTVGFNYSRNRGVITDTSSDMEYSIDSTNGTDGTWTTASDGTTYFTADNVNVYVREASNPSNFLKLGNIPQAPSTISVTGVTLNKGTLTVEAGKSDILQANLYPANATNKAVTWKSSNTDVAIVDGSGNVSGVSAGSASITVTTTDGSKTATCVVTVTSPGLQNIALNKLATASGSNSGQGPDQAVDGNTSTKWCHDGTNQWMQLDLGQNYDISRWVVVSAGIAESTSLNTRGCTLQKSVDGKTWTTVDAVTDNTDTTMSRTVPTFTARYIKLIVDNPVQPDAPSYLPPAARIHELELWGIKDVPVTGISVSPTSQSISVGDGANLNATITPANATNKNVTWTSSSSDVATVDSTGSITAVSVGTTTITATTADGNKTATCTVTITPAVVKNVALNKAATASGNNNGEGPAQAVDGSTSTKWCHDGVGEWLQLDLGRNYDISRWVVVSAGIVESTSLNTRGCTLQKSADGKTWTNVDKVTDNAGTTMSRTVPTFTARYVKLVVDNPVQPNAPSYLAPAARIHEFELWGIPSVPVVAAMGVTVSPTSQNLAVGSSAQLTATVSPANATNKTVIWTSSNSKVATVDNSGKVTAVAVGTATITATTADGNKTATCTVTVANSTVAVTGITINPTTQNLTVGNSAQLTATIFPANATNKNVTWTSSDSNVATIDSNGKVTAVAAGTTTITATTADGNKTATCAIIVQNSSSHSNSSSFPISSTPATTPSTITTTVSGNGSTVETVSTKPDSAPVVSGNRSSVSATVPSDVASVIVSATADKPAEVKIAVPASDIIGQLDNSAVKSVDLTIKAPTSVTGNTNANAHIAIDADASILQAAKNAQKDVTFTVTNSDTGKEAYSWTFSGSGLKNSIAPVGNVNLAVSVTSVGSDSSASGVVGNNTSDRKAAGLVLKFGNNGLLPGTAQVKVYVGDQANSAPGAKVYLYYLNHAINALEQLPQSEYTVDANGYVTFTISHCSDYVVLPKAATNPYAVKCDTTFLTGLKNGKSYTFAMTVNGNVIPSFTVGNGKAFVTGVKHVGNKYYVTVRAIGTAGATTAVYSTLPNQKPAVMDYITITK